MVMKIPFNVFSGEQPPAHQGLGEAQHGHEAL